MAKTMDDAAYRRGQRDALAVAMTVICQHCHAGFYGRKAMNDIVRDGGWLNADMRTATHYDGSRKRKCRAAKLIPPLLMVLSFVATGSDAAPSQGEDNG